MSEQLELFGMIFFVVVGKENDNVFVWYVDNEEGNTIAMSRDMFDTELGALAQATLEAVTIALADFYGRNYREVYNLLHS